MGVSLKYLKATPFDPIGLKLIDLNSKLLFAQPPEAHKFRIDQSKTALEMRLSDSTTRYPAESIIFRLNLKSCLILVRATY